MKFSPVWSVVKVRIETSKFNFSTTKVVFCRLELIIETSPNYYYWLKVTVTVCKKIKNSTLNKSVAFTLALHKSLQQFCGFV